MLNIGSVLIHRSITAWEWYKDIPTRVLFEHLIFTVSWKDGKFRGETVHRGERVCSLPTLEEETGLSIQQLRSAIKKLEKTGEITRRQIQGKTVLSVVNFQKYQKINRQLTDEQQTSNRQSTDDSAQENEGFSVVEEKSATDKQQTSNRRLHTRLTDDQQGDKESNNKINNNIYKYTRAREEVLPSLEKVEDDELRELYLEYAKMRVDIKSPMTAYSMKLLVSKVGRLESKVELQKELLKNAIVGKWKSVYPLKDDERAEQRDKTYDTRSRFAAAVERTRRNRCTEVRE